MRPVEENSFCGQSVTKSAMHFLAPSDISFGVHPMTLREQDRYDFKDSICCKRTRRLSSFRIPRHIASSNRNVARDCVSQIYVFIATKWKVAQEGGWPLALFGYLIHGQERGLLAACPGASNKPSPVLSLPLSLYVSLSLSDGI